MATKFIQLEEAAEILGISPEKLSQMREQNEIRGFRDGSNWKFKAEELDRVKATLGTDDLELDLDETDTAEAGSGLGDSILLSEKELGAESVGSSTVIGQSTSGTTDHSDLSTSSATDHSDLKLPDDEFSQSDIDLGGSSITGGSNVHTSSESDVLGDSGSVGSRVDAGSELQLPEGAASAAVELSGSDLSGSDLSDSDTVKSHKSDLELGDEAPESPGSSGFEVESGSEIDLTDEDDNLVLGGTGSDVVGASDSGISLGDPSDSGLSLEEGPLDLGGSVIGDDSLLLGEEDMIALDDGAEPGGTTQLKSEDDFLLTPLEDAGGDESESSSQVIELDDPTQPQTDFSNASMTMLEDELMEDATTGGGPATFIEDETIAPIMPMAPAVPEAPYSIWNVLSMLVCIVILSVAGMLMYDLVRQVWSWDGVHPVNSGMMDAIIGMFR